MDPADDFIFSPLNQHEMQNVHFPDSSTPSNTVSSGLKSIVTLGSTVSDPAFNINSPLDVFLRNANFENSNDGSRGLNSSIGGSGRGIGSAIDDHAHTADGGHAMHDSAKRDFHEAFNDDDGEPVSEEREEEEEEEEETSPPVHAVASVSLNDRALPALEGCAPPSYLLKVRLWKS